MRISEEQFNQNVNRWALSCPSEASRLSSIENFQVSFCTTGDGDLNLKKENAFYHSQEDASKEAAEWFESLDLYYINSLFVYGVGLGYYYQAAKEWLRQSPTRMLIFIEDDLEVIHRLLETELGSELLFDDQVRLQFIHPQQEEEVDSIPYYFFLFPLKFSALDYYRKQNPDYLDDLSLQIEYVKSVRLARTMEYMNVGQGFFSNYYRNLLELPSAFLADHMFGKFKGVPAIICGAGPSLEKNLPTLEKLKDRALIFGGGSAMNAINRNGFLPHFGVSIDPNWNQYSRLVMNQAFQTPYFYRNRVFPEALREIYGDHLFVTGAGGHDIATWFEEKLEIQGNKISEGNNVVNFSMAIAQALGCFPIILVGVDLAYSEQKSYAPGVIQHPILDLRQPLLTRGAQEEIITRKDVNGEPVPTLWKWLIESIWLSQFAEKLPEGSVINATEGGIGAPGIPNMTLEEVLSTVLTLPMDLQTRVHGEIQNSSLPDIVSKEKIVTLFQEMQKSLEACSELITTIESDYQNTLEQMEKTQECLSCMESSESLNSLKQEIAYTYILKRFSDAFIKYHGQHELEKYFQEHEGAVEQIDLCLKRTGLIKKRYSFLKQVIKANLDYIAIALEENQEKEERTPKSERQESQPSEENSAIRYELEGNRMLIHDEEMDLSVDEEISLNPAAENSCLKYADGSTKMKCFYQNGELHGPSRYYAQDGSLLAESWFVHGLRQGRSVTYNQDSQLASKQRYRDGLMDGPQMFYFPTGNLKALLPYQRGKLNGSVELFFPDGSKKRELVFSDGKRQGMDKTWYPSGEKEFQIDYANDKPVGIAKSWHANGKTAVEVIYDQDSKVLSIMGWTREGSPISDDSFLSQDYFSLVSKQTHILTDSIEEIYSQLKKISPIGAENELDELQEEMENFKKLNAEITEKIGTVSDETKEALWKTPETKRLLGKQVEESAAEMSKIVEDIEELLKLTGGLLKKKPPQDKGNDS